MAEENDRNEGHHAFEDVTSERFEILVYKSLLAV